MKLSFNCANKVVKAVLVTLSGKCFFGQNDRVFETAKCPRIVVSATHQEMYHLCKEVCAQRFHAETDALDQAKREGTDVTGSIMYIFGHTKCCDNCKQVMLKAGVAGVYFSSPEGWKQEILKG